MQAKLRHVATKSHDLHCSRALEDRVAFREMISFAPPAHLIRLLQGIREKKALDDALKGQLNSTLKEFKERFVSQHAPAKA